MSEKKIFYIGGILTETEVQECIKRNISYDAAANNFQNKFLKGFKLNEVNMINVPFVRFSRNRILNYVSYKTDNKKINYLNISYISNIFKYFALKKIARTIDFSNSVIFCYAVHTPFLKLIRDIKKTNKNVTVVLIVPDLPQFMNMEQNVSMLYKLLKCYDISVIERLLHNVDFFVPFTRLMYEDYLEKYAKPYYVMEGIYEPRIKFKEEFDTSMQEKRVVYTGTLNKKYGVEKLIEIFEKMDDPNIILYICGNGELKEDLLLNNSENIKYLGNLKYEEALKVIDSATLLINPRENVGEFTKYSFPSKIFDYLSAEKRILCFKLSGIPDEYDEYLDYFQNSDSKYMRCRIKEIAYDSNSVKRRADSFLLTKTAERHIENIYEKLEESM